MTDPLMMMMMWGLFGEGKQKFSQAYCNRLPWLKQFIGHIDATTREAMARLLGIVTAALSPLQAATLLEELLSTFSGSQKGRYAQDLYRSAEVLSTCSLLYANWETQV